MTNSMLANMSSYPLSKNISPSAKQRFLSKQVSCIADLAKSFQEEVIESSSTDLGDEAYNHAVYLVAIGVLGGAVVVLLLLGLLASCAYQRKRKVKVKVKP